MEIHLRTSRRRLPYGITHCYLPPDTSEHTPASEGMYCMTSLWWNSVTRTVHPSSTSCVCLQRCLTSC